MKLTATETPLARSQPSSTERLSDEELLLRYRRNGDRRLFEALVHRYEHELYNYLRRYLGDSQAAEDAFQSAFLQVHLKCDQFEEGRSFRPWLYTIATNRAIDARRSNKRHRMVSLDGNKRDLESFQLADLLVGSEPDPLARVEQSERELQVQQALETLPEFLRSAVALVYFQGLKYREAAEVLSVPVGTVKSRVHTAIMKLAEFWKDSPVKPR